MEPNKLASVPVVEYSEDHFRDMMGQNTYPRLIDQYWIDETQDQYLNRIAEEEERRLWEDMQELIQPDPWDWIMNPDGHKNPSRGFFDLGNGIRGFID